jgi:hypothetical protein
MMQLTEEEVEIMLSQNAIPSKQVLAGSLPYAFTWSFNVVECAKKGKSNPSKSRFVSIPHWHAIIVLRTTTQHGATHFLPCPLRSLSKPLLESWLIIIGFFK